ncbi:MAG: hypothetical protein IJW55_04205 [Clostridia bacterium]|nr:hypothetical protein [Clostridia bacterium]
MKKALRILALSIVLVTLVAAFASCGGPAKDPDDALAALKENDYAAAEDKVLIPLALKALGVDDIDSVVSGTKTADGKVEHITIVYFEDKDAANEAWETVEKYAEDNKEDDSDWVVKKSGAMIYYGTSAGVKAAK